MNAHQFETILYQVEGVIGLITLNRPESLNAFSRKMVLELTQVLSEIAGQPEIRVVILTGAGDKAFAAGADIRELQTFSPTQARGFGLRAKELDSKIEALEKPVIAAINGVAAGGGLEVALACDLRIASAKARFGQPEINLGLIPGGGATQRLSKAIGLIQAKEWILTGEIVSAEEAFKLGLVNKVVPPEELMSEAKRLAEKLAQKSPIALALAKSALNQSVDLGGLLYEVECFAQCFATEDHDEGIKAFLERRAPKFTGQ